MKDNYKAQDLKFYARNEEEARQFHKRAFELGYEYRATQGVFYSDKFLFYLWQNEKISYGEEYLHFVLRPHKQITLEEFLAPQRGETVQVMDANRYVLAEFIFDLGEEEEYRYFVKSKLDGVGQFWKQMRPMQKQQPKEEPLGMFKDFQANIELLEQAIEGLKERKP